MRKFQEEIARLKEQLEGKGGKGGRKSGRRRRQNADGTEVDEGEDGGDQADEELFLKEQQDKLNEDKRAIMHKKNINGRETDFLRERKIRLHRLETERQTMLRELDEQKQEIEREQEERQKMQHKIQEMQSKLITGGKDIVTHTSEQEQALRQKRSVRRENLSLDNDR